MTTLVTIRRRLMSQMMRAGVILALATWVFFFPAAIFFSYALPRTTPQSIRYSAMFATLGLGTYCLVRLQMGRDSRRVLPALWRKS